MSEHSVTIIDSTPSHIQARIGDRTVIIGCEAILPGCGPPDFVLYRDTVNRWDPPHETELLDEIAKDEVIERVKFAMETNMKWTVEIE
jgi:hypothetical protein